MKLSVWQILQNIFLIVACLVIGFVAVLLFSGARSFAVESDSMAPMLRKGDMVCVRATDFESLQPGDVISAYFPQSDGVFTHRIVTIDADKRQITTRGDGNMHDDPMPTDASRIIGKYWFSVPFVGLLSLHLENYTLLYILLGVAILLIAVRIVLSLRKKTKG